MDPHKIKSVHRAAQARRSAVEDMGVDHRCLDIALAQEFLDRLDVGAFSKPSPTFFMRVPVLAQLKTHFQSYI